MALRKTTAFSLVVLATTLILPAQAMSTIDGHQLDLQQLGNAVCQQILDDVTDGLFGGVDYDAAVKEAGLDRPKFCGCVGNAFAFSADDQAAALEDIEDETVYADMFAKIVTENLNLCLSPDHVFHAAGVFDSEEDECADGCQDGPVWEDEWDQLQCEYGIDGWTEPSGFDRAHVQDWIDDSGIDAQSLCTCAAMIMKDQSEDYLAEQAETNDPELYWSYMRGAIDQCQMAMWRRPLQ